MKQSKILSLMLALMLMVGAAVPVLADTETGADSAGTDIVTDVTETGGSGDVAAPADPADPAEPVEPSEPDEPEVPAHTTSKNVSLRGFGLVFSSAVITDETIENADLADNLKATGKSNYVKLTWTKAGNTDVIDGYIILRKDLSGSKWRQIATAKKTATSYKDKTAKKKNTLYKYTIVAYRKTDDGRLITKPVHWAGAVTTKSKKKNVYSISVSKPAKSSAVRVDNSTTISISWPSKPYSKTLRWTSSNKNIATVSSSGKVTGIKPGKVTIYARTHTGFVLKVKVTVVEGGTAQAMIDVMESWYGYGYTKHKGIIEIYNADKPLPVNYAMTYNDAWCAASVTAAAIVSANTPRTGKECSVDRFITIFKNKGIWIEDGTITPKPGDLIVYSWRKSTQPNNAVPSHIGIVEKVENGKITAIEGNTGVGVVARRTMSIGWGYIRGYARPDYKEEPEQ